MRGVQERNSSTMDSSEVKTGEYACSSENWVLDISAMRTLLNQVPRQSASVWMLRRIRNACSIVVNAYTHTDTRTQRKGGREINARVKDSEEKVYDSERVQERERGGRNCPGSLFSIRVHLRYFAT